MLENRSRVRVKICGVVRPEDARHAASAGADYVGAILSPDFPRSVEPEIAAGFLGGDQAVLVGVFVDRRVAEVVRAARVAGAGVIQLHGDEPGEDVRTLRDEGDWRIWKAVRVQRAEDIEVAIERWVGVVDGLLLDGMRPGQAGGAGARFPWSALEMLRGSIPADLDLIVAGGLSPESVAQAVTRLSPQVVDVSSGVEARVGVKDAARVRAFIERARSQDQRRRDRIAEAG